MVTPRFGIKTLQIRRRAFSSRPVIKNSLRPGGEGECVLKKNYLHHNKNIIAFSGRHKSHQYPEAPSPRRGDLHPERKDADRTYRA